MHRLVEWQTVYDLEYVVDMKWWGSGGGALSRERWFTLRNEALKQLSLEYYGHCHDCDQSDVRLTPKQAQVSK